MNYALNALVGWYENLSPASLEKIADYYTEDAWFHDPFNDVRSADHIKSIMLDMFARLEQPRFVVKDRFWQGNQAFINWHFMFTFRRKPRLIMGSTHLHFATDGRVRFHRDYWDAAELYEMLPVLGWLLRRLRQNVGSSADCKRDAE